VDPVTLATITGVTGAAKLALEIARDALLKGKGRGAERANQEALALVDSLNARLVELEKISLQLHAEKTQAIEENTRLRAEIREQEERAAERQRYKSQKVGASLLLVRDDDPEIFYCPTCAETKRFHISLQPHWTWGDNPSGYRCNSCETVFPL